MAGTLEEFFVSIGVKGQNVVLKNIAKVKKEANNLSKLKPTLDMGKGNISKAISSIKSIPPVSGITGQAPITQPSSEQKKEDKQQKENTNKFSNGINKFNNGANSILKSSQNFDPVELVQKAITVTGKALGAVAAAIPAIGAYLKDFPPALAEATNAMVGMGTGALEMAKQAASGQWRLQSRNATVAYYGGGNVGREAERADISNSEYATLMMKVAGTNGKISSELKEIITELSKTKDTEMLGNVASGNFAAIGTTQGWIMQQMMDSMGNVPPEIRQKMTAALLPKISSDIMGRDNEDAQEDAQRVNAKYERQNENQIAKLYNASATAEGLTELNEAIINMKVTMFNAGVGMATTINEATKKIGELADSIKKAKDEIQSSTMAPDWVKAMFK